MMTRMTLQICSPELVLVLVLELVLQGTHPAQAQHRAAVLAQEEQEVLPVRS
jgi:hypothetical protein